MQRAPNFMPTTKPRERPCRGGEGGCCWSRCCPAYRLGRRSAGSTRGGSPTGRAATSSGHLGIGLRSIANQPEDTANERILGRGRTHPDRPGVSDTAEPPRLRPCTGRLRSHADYLHDPKYVGPVDPRHQNARGTLVRMMSRASTAQNANGRPKGNRDAARHNGSQLC